VLIFEPQLEDGRIAGMGVPPVRLGWVEQTSGRRAVSEMS